jgi:hypothetical protein
MAEGNRFPSLNGIKDVPVLVLLAINSKIFMVIFL